MKHCVNCGEPIPGATKRAKYCSTRCKSQHWRDQRNPTPRHDDRREQLRTVTQHYATPKVPVRE